MTEADLFSYTPPARYPEAPGFKARDTAKAAAEAIAPRAPLLRDRCLAFLKGRPSTPDEVAGALDVSILSIRPRISELAADGYIEDTGQRRSNASGRKAIVWRVKA